MKTNSFPQRVQFLVNKVYSTLTENVADFSSWHYTVKYFYVKKLVCYAFNNNANIDAEDFDFMPYVGNVGIKYCDSRNPSNELVDYIEHYFNVIKK